MAVHVASGFAVDEMQNERDQREADIADRHEQRRAGLVAVPHVVTEQRRHLPRDRQPAIGELLAMLPVEREHALPLVAGLDLGELARRHIGRIDDVDAAIVGEEQRGAAPVRGAAEGAAVAVADGGRPAAVPQRNPADPGAGGDEQRLLELVERHRRMARAVAERSFRDLEAETEAPRAAAVERREQRIVPHALQQLGLSGFGHRQNLRLRFRANLAFNWPHQVVQFAKSRQTTFFGGPMRSRGWAELYDWRLDRGSATPVCLQIYGQVRAAVLARTLGPGTRLPSSRALAAQLGAARASVVAAYEQLLAEGYVFGRTGSGTYVATDLPEAVVGAARRRNRLTCPRRWSAPASARAFAEFAPSTAQTDERPFNTGRTLVDARTIEVWRKLTHRAVRTLGAQHLGYTDPRGLTELRRSIAEYLQAARGVRADPEQIVVTAGTQQAIDIAIRVLLAPGERVWVEDPGYFLTRRQLMLADAVLQPIPVDAEGLRVDVGIATAPRARAAFVTPSHQFPTGVVLSMARRLALIAWARKAGAFIVEDDYASEFRYSGRPLAALQGLDEDERVIYVGTLNKALFPGLRSGYAVVPQALLQACVAALYLIDRRPPSLHQAVVAEFMREGYFAAYPPHAAHVPGAARRARQCAGATRRRQCPDRCVGSRHAPRRPSPRRLVRYRRRGRRQAARYRCARHEPVLSGGAAPLRADAGVQRLPAAGDQAGGGALSRDHRPRRRSEPALRLGPVP